MTRAKKPKFKKEDLVRRYQDLLEIARLVSWCMNRDHLVKTCLDHISQRLGKRARYVLMEGDELKLHCLLSPLKDEPTPHRNADPLIGF